MQSMETLGDENKTGCISPPYLAEQVIRIVYSCFSKTGLRCFWRQNKYFKTGTRRVWL